MFFQNLISPMSLSGKRAAARATKPSRQNLPGSQFERSERVDCGSGFPPSSPAPAGGCRRWRFDGYFCAAKGDPRGLRKAAAPQMRDCSSREIIAIAGKKAPAGSRLRARRLNPSLASASERTNGTKPPGFAMGLGNFKKTGHGLDIRATGGAGQDETANTHVIAVAT